MKNVISAVLLGIILSSCSSLQHKVFKVQPGDPSGKAIALLGPPTAFGQSQRDPEAQAWYYVDGDRTCGVTVKDRTITFVFCENEDPYGGDAQNQIRKVSSNPKQDSNYSLLSPTVSNSLSQPANTYNATNMYFNNK